MKPCCLVPEFTEVEWRIRARVHARAILNCDGRIISDHGSNDERRARQRPREDRPADLRGPSITRDVVKAYLT